MSKKLSILLSTYNGEKYIKEQLDSLTRQTYKNFHIITRDDKSVDKTLDVLKPYDIEIMESKKNIGAKKSFFALITHALKHSKSDYFMFCDQDDIWEKDKIKNTHMKMLEMEILHPNTPILVHTDLKIVDEKLHALDNSFWKYEHIDPSLNSFNRLLMHNTITGCTVMINANLAKLALPISDESIMHDWWLGLVASKFGKIGFINETTVLYRQHANNSVGVKGFSYLGILKEGLNVLMNGNFYIKHLDANVKQAKSFLKTYKDSLDKQTIETLEDFISIEKQTFFKRRKILLKHKILKQGFIRNLGLMLKI